MVHPEKEHTSRSQRTLDVTRGTTTLLRNMGYATLQEFCLPSGHRIDIAGVNKRGDLIFVEVKSSRADFISDKKWHHYIDNCHQIFFAVTIGFPIDLLPTEAGIIFADQFDGEVFSKPRRKKLHSARHKKLLIAFAQQAATRLATHSFS